MKKIYILTILVLLISGCSRQNSPNLNYSYNHHYNQTKINKSVTIDDGTSFQSNTVITYEYPKENIVQPFPIKTEQKTKPIIFQSFPTPTPINIHKTNKRDYLKKEPTRLNYIPKPKIKNYYQKPHYFNVYSNKGNSHFNKSFRIIKYAKKMLGTPYVYGANGPYEYDCSSFTKKVFKDALNINIPRVSREQAQVGKLIRNKKYLKPGDLIFFGDKNHHSVRHVGIYIGNDKFIHDSSGPKKVVITRLSKPYYKKHFKWGRRLL